MKKLSGFVLSVIGGPILSSMLFAAVMVCATEARAQRAPEGCSITYRADDDIIDMMRSEHFSFDGYDSLCARLRAEKMGIDIRADQGVLEDRAFGWATVRFYHRGIDIPGLLGRSTTILNRDPSSPGARLAGWQAINSSLKDIAADPQRYINSVFEAERDAAEKLAKVKALRPTAFVATPAKASTVYLECKIASPSGSSAVNVDVTLNEAAGTAGFTIRETGFSVQGIAAAFGPSRVTWVRHDSFAGVGTDVRYSVDRTTLEMLEEWPTRGGPLFVRKGTCKLASPMPRKF